MSVRVTQLSYNSGVMSGLMQGRADDSKYASGVQVCRNARCTPQGPLENRPGFMYVNEVKYPDKPTRLIPYTFSATETMVIELGDKYIRFHTNGQTLMNGDVPYELVTPWAAEDLFELHYTQNANKMTLVHPYYPPQELTRRSLLQWDLVEARLIPTLRAPSSVSAAVASSGEGSDKNKTEQRYVVTALNEDRTEESVKSSAAKISVNLYATGTSVKISWTKVDGAKYYRVYKLQGGLYGFIGETDSTSIIDENIAPETGETPPIIDDAFAVLFGITKVDVVNGGSGYGRGEAYVSGTWSSSNFGTDRSWYPDAWDPKTTGRFRVKVVGSIRGVISTGVGARTQWKGVNDSGYSEPEDLEFGDAFASFFGTTPPNQGDVYTPGTSEGRFEYKRWVADSANTIPSFNTSASVAPTKGFVKKVYPSGGSGFGINETGGRSYYYRVTDGTYAGDNQTEAGFKGGYGKLKWTKVDVSTSSGGGVEERVYDIEYELYFDAYAKFSITTKSKGFGYKTPGKMTVYSDSRSGVTPSGDDFFGSDDASSSIHDKDSGQNHRYQNYIVLTRNGASVGLTEFINRTATRIYWQFRGDHSMTQEINVNPYTDLIVEDPTGSGCELRWEIDSNGTFTKVDVLNPGGNYSDPTIRVDTTSTGSGAEFSIETGTTGSYPASVGYFEQRRIFAGSRSRPQTVWMTATGTESNMTYHLPLQDDDRISFTVASRDLNQIQHVVALQQLLMLTSAAEWRVSPLNSDAITPTSISVRPQSYVGASNVQPVLANNTAIYAASRGGHVREIAYNYNAGGYVTGDLSLRAEDMFTGKEILDLAYSKEPYPVVWAVSSGGALLGLTYVPEQQVGAWFSYETEGKFMSATVVQEGLDDVIYVITNRTINGVKKAFVECSTRRDDTSNKSGVYLDCAGLYVGEPTNKVSGVKWLAGQEVTVNADGNIITGIKVGADGSVTIPVEAARISVGLPYSVEIQTMPIVAQVSDGSLAKGHTKNVNRVWLRLKSSAAPEVGPSFDNMEQVKPRTKEPYGAPPKLIDGVVEAMPPGKWEDDTGVCIRMDRPLPFTLISHSADIELGG